MVSGVSGMDKFLDWAIPAILLVIALGFIYTHFIGPWVTPNLIKLWEWMNKGGKDGDDSGSTGRKEITYE